MFNWFKKRRKKKNEILLWAVTDYPVYDECGTVYTVTPTEDGCYEYINRYLYNKYGEHFENWRVFHNSEEEDWNYYVENVLLDMMEEDFYIVAFYANTYTCAMAYRVYECCQPLGCSYEFEVERIAYKCYLEDKEKEDKEDDEEKLPIQ